MNPPTPQNHLRYDPWTTSSTGHQVADSAASTAYRSLRQEKLSRQFGEGQGDCTVVRGRGRGELQRGMWVEEDAKRGSTSGSGSGSGLGKGQRDIRRMFGVGKGSSGSASSKKVDGDGDMGTGVLVKGTLSSAPSDHHIYQEEHSTTPTTTQHLPKPQTNTNTTSNAEPNTLQPTPSPSLQTEYPQLFTTLKIYINTPSHPLLSDHKLKQILTLHGATIALSLSRRVTHIIVGKPNTRPGSGAGGGLASGKLQREMSRGGARAWKVVFVEWVLESIKAGKRLSEARFAMPLATGTQRSVFAFAGR